MVRVVGDGAAREVLNQIALVLNVALLNAVPSGELLHLFREAKPFAGYRPRRKLISQSEKNSSGSSPAVAADACRYLMDAAHAQHGYWWRKLHSGKWFTLHCGLPPRNERDQSHPGSVSGVRIKPEEISALASLYGLDPNFSRPQRCSTLIWSKLGAEEACPRVWYALCYRRTLPSVALLSSHALCIYLLFQSGLYRKGLRLILCLPIGSVIVARKTWTAIVGTFIGNPALEEARGKALVALLLRTPHKTLALDASLCRSMVAIPVAQGV